MKANENGFTLIEILVAIAIMAILSSIAVVNFQKSKAMAQATQIASHLHVIEDGIIGAILDGYTENDFGGRIDSTNLKQSILKTYLTEANFSDVPKGITLYVTPMRSNNPPQFFIMVMVRGDKRTEETLEALEKMFPKTMTHLGSSEFVVVDSNTLKEKPK